MVTFAYSQTDLLQVRLVHSWKLIKMEENGVARPSDPTLTDYRLIFKSDFTVQQGLIPDGLINGTYTVDDANMIVTITDKQTKVDYKVKVIKITTDELILQDLSDKNSMLMYYQLAEK